MSRYRRTGRSGSGSAVAISALSIPPLSSNATGTSLMSWSSTTSGHSRSKSASACSRLVIFALRCGCQKLLDTPSVAVGDQRAPWRQRHNPVDQATGGSGITLREEPMQAFR